MKLSALQLNELLEGYDGEALAAQLTCPVCGSESSVDDNACTIHPERPLAVDLRRCIRCHHGWIDPLPAQAFLNHLYGRGSRSVIGPDRVKTEFTIPEAIAACEAATLPATRYLEIGVGQGLLYRHFAAAGWSTAGVDPGDWAASLPGVVRSIDDIDVGRRFDLIAAMDVLEHVRDPVAMVRRLRELAAPGARLFMAFPNRASLRARVGKGRWRMVRPLGHLHFFSPRSARLMLKEAGWDAEQVRTTDLMHRNEVHDVRSALLYLGQLLGLGDQLIVSARPNTGGRDTA
jgi:2-polyprenyl-3-methyl-5-hydroxy-6-metoxy-1,4-benzoquinol methylase